MLDLENGEKGEWGFKALKQMIKINFKLQNYNEMMVRYKQLLTYIKSAVTRNHSEKSINSILDYISTSKNVSEIQWQHIFWWSVTVLLMSVCFVCFRWNFCKISMKQLWRRWRMQKMIDSGSKPTRNLENSTSIEVISANCRKFWNSCINHVK